MLQTETLKTKPSTRSKPEIIRQDLRQAFSGTDLDGFYCSAFTDTDGYDLTCLYVHGGPGSHCEDFEAGIEQIPTLSSSRIRWIVYDQRHCGRSIPIQVSSVSETSHSSNVADFDSLVTILKDRCGIKVDVVYGHSYGARLAFDAFESNADIDSALLLGGRSVNRLDGLNHSLLMDLMILRRLYPERYDAAYAIVSSCESGSPRALHIEVRNLFPNMDERQRERSAFYWGNPSALSWFENARSQFSQSDNDEIFCAVAGTILRQHDGGCPLLNPAKIQQPFQLILGFFDFIMGGAGEPELGPEHVVRFNGSGHYPHFEEPKRFAEVVRNMALQAQVRRSES